MPDNLTQAFESMKILSTRILNFLPTLLIALVVLIVGWLLARLIRVLVTKFLAAVRFDRLVKTGLRASTVANVLYWGVIFVVIIAVLEVLGLSTGELVLMRLTEILPRVFAAILILMLGLVFALIAGGMTRALVSSTTIKHRLLWVQAVRWLTMGFVGVLALEQLGIAAQLVVSLILIVVGAAAFSFALAVGLGCKDIARDMIIEFFKKEEE
jgi:hypothetical protein